jgi:hypothetical protein
MIENIHSFFSCLSIIQGKFGIGSRIKRKAKIDDTTMEQKFKVGLANGLSRKFIFHPSCMWPT